MKYDQHDLPSPRKCKLKTTIVTNSYALEQLKLKSLSNYRCIRTYSKEKIGGFLKIKHVPNP
jgi:hypothetical protein